MNWKNIYDNAVAFLFEFCGPKIKTEITPFHIRACNTWMRTHHETGASPSPDALHFAMFDETPPPGFGNPKTLTDFLNAVHKSQGEPLLTERQIALIDLYSKIVFLLRKGIAPKDLNRALQEAWPEYFS